MQYEDESVLSPQGIDERIKFLISNRIHKLNDNEEDKEVYENFLESDSLNQHVIFLQSLWKTEENSPEILPYKTDLVDSIKAVLADRQEKINDSMEDKNASDFFTINIYQMDIDRIRYVLLNYLRCRVKKIEKNLDFLMASQDKDGEAGFLQNLSLEERIFLTKLNNLNVQHFENSLYSRLNEESGHYFRNNTDDRIKHATPNYNSFVIMQALEPLEDLSIDDNTQVNLSPGDIVMIKYNLIREHVLRDQVQLI